jgi:cell division protein FtsN
MAEQDPFEKKPPKKKSLSEELLKDDFFKPPIDDIYPVEKETSEHFLEAEPPATPFLEEEPPISPLEDTFEPLLPEEEPQVKVFGDREEVKGIDPKKIALIAGGSLVVVLSIIVGVRFLGGEEKQTLVQAPVAQPLTQAPAPPVPTTPSPPTVTGHEPPAPPPVPPLEQTRPPEPPPPKKVIKKPAAPPAVAAKPAPRLVHKYTLEVGKYSKREFARHNRTLIRLGLSPFSITEKETSEINYVVVDQRYDEAEARAASMKVEFVGGIKNKIITQSDGSLTIQAGPFNSLNKAIETKNTISGLGLATRIDFSSSTKVVYCLRVGKFATHADADKTLALLRQNGYSPKIKSLK